MRDSTALLVSGRSSLVEAVAGANGSIDRLHLQVCGRVADAFSYLERDDLALTLVHLGEEAEHPDVARLVSAAAERSVTTVVLSDMYRSQQAVRLLRAGA